MLRKSEIFQRLSETSVISQRPEVTSTTMENTFFIPHIANRFHQILFPAFQRFNTMLTTFETVTALEVPRLSLKLCPNRRLFVNGIF